jgi:hypothetical protein
MILELMKLPNTVAFTKEEFCSSLNNYIATW